MVIVSMRYCHPVQMSFQGFDRESQKRLWGITQKACSLSLRLYSAIITHTCTHTSSTNTACHRIWWNLRICVLPVRCAYREEERPWAGPIFLNKQIWCLCYSDVCNFFGSSIRLRIRWGPNSVTTVKKFCKRFQVRAILASIFHVDTEVFIP